MPPKKSVAAIAGDSSEVDEINVNKVVETKKELDKIRKERDKKRAHLQADLDKHLDDLRARINQSVTAHTQQLDGIHQQKVDRLLKAIDARDTILQTISDKLAEAQAAGSDLAAYLNGAYEYRVKKAESFLVSVENKTGHQDKKTKVEAA
ncbi:hypothetical protein VM1G_02066 [Cytospora mali]|uniref:Uncharacterized protein n=1 Tax=Cytospora mali TaxID=578113 RepID=A0A194VSE1_CYTMA|nr:hypothetical protein VM1G_02066 [Valsa mali]